MALLLNGLMCIKPDAALSGRSKKNIQLNPHSHPPVHTIPMQHMSTVALKVELTNIARRAVIPLNNIQQRYRTMVNMTLPLYNIVR